MIKHNKHAEIMIIIERTWTELSEFTEGLGPSCRHHTERMAFRDDDICGVRHYIDQVGEFKYTKL